MVKTTQDIPVPGRPSAPAPRKKMQRLDLPFTRRKRDAGTWVYNHRAGLCITLIAYLLMAIAFVGSKIAVKGSVRPAGIVLDMRTLEELQNEKERLEQEVRMRLQERGRMSSGGTDGSYASNIVSNDGLDLRDDRNTDMSALRNRAGNLNGKMQSNRDVWERGMREIASMGAGGDGSGGGGGTGGDGVGIGSGSSGGGGSGSGNGQNKGMASGDVRVKGRVTVSFSLVNPVRYSENLIVPAYRCERGGEVVVRITVNRNGAVTAASVDSGLSDNDSCMHETALDSALRSRFNLDTSAPERQTGTITYIFVPQ